MNVDSQKNTTDSEIDTLKLVSIVSFTDGTKMDFLTFYEGFTKLMTLVETANKIQSASNSDKHLTPGDSRFAYLVADLASGVEVLKNRVDFAHMQGVADSIGQVSYAVHHLSQKFLLPVADVVGKPLSYVQLEPGSVVSNWEDVAVALENMKKPAKTI